MHRSAAGRQRCVQGAEQAGYFVISQSLGGNPTYHIAGIDQRLASAISQPKRSLANVMQVLTLLNLAPLRGGQMGALAKKLETHVLIAFFWR